MARSVEAHLKDHLLSPPSYHEATNHQQQIESQSRTLPDVHTIILSAPSPTDGNHAEVQSRRHPCQAIVITAIIVGGIILIAIIASLTFIFVKRTSIIPPTTTTTTTTKRPICFDGDGLLVKEDGSQVKIRHLKIGDQILVAYQTRNQHIELRSSPILALDIFQKYNNNSPVDFLEIELESNVSIKPLHITPKHSLLVKKKDQFQANYFFADQVQMGDYLYLMKNDHHSTIQVKVARINKIKLFDAYAPLTLEGTLLVNDVIVSCYGTFKHSFVHLLMTPRRWLLYSAYQLTSFIKGATYMKEHLDFLGDYFITIDFFRLSIRNRILDFIDLFKYQ